MDKTATERTVMYEVSANFAHETFPVLPRTVANFYDALARRFASTGGNPVDASVI